MISDFRDLLAELVRADVRFLVVGAHALAAHGVPRATGDLDLWVEPSPANSERVWDALLRFGAPLDALGITRADFVRADQVVQLGLPPYRIDLLTSVSGVEFVDAWRGRTTGALFGIPVSFIGRQEFIQNKRAAGRPKDREDLRSLEDPGQA